MKRGILAACLGMSILSCSSGGGSDDGPVFYLPPRWANQQRVPTYSDLRAVRFNTATQGFIAGFDSSIYRTDDGGATWFQSEHQPYGRSGKILGLDFLGFSVHAVGTDEGGTLGRFWRSGDGLNFSTDDQPGNGSPFVSVDVTTGPSGDFPAVGWYLRENWDVRVQRDAQFSELTNIPDPGGKATSIDMLFDGRGYVVGEGGAIFETGNFGSAWNARTGGGTNDLYDVHYVGGGAAFVCGVNGTLLWTETGGNLTQVPNGPGAGTFRGVHFFHEFRGFSTGWVVGNAGLIRKITGTYDTLTSTWSWSWSAPLPSNTAEDLYDVHFVDDQVGYAVGNKGTVVRTLNGGTSWTLLTRGSTETINAISFDPTATVGVAAGDGGKVYVTLNGGQLWTESDLGTQTFTGAAIPPGNPDVAYVCGLNGQLYRTLNIRATPVVWTPSGDGDLAGKNLRAILFPSSADVGFVVGDGSTLLYTNDGMTGFGWQAPAGVPAGNYKAICMGIKTVGGLTLFAAGDGGLIAEQELVDYPLAWTALAEPNQPAGNITAIQAGGVDFLVAATSDGTLRRRLAGVWQVASKPTAAPAAAGLAFPTSSFGWWVSDKIYYTENGANPDPLLFDWKSSFAHTTSTFRSIWMNQTGTIGYVTGTNGLILKTVTGGK